jgi:hypothetical protein
MKLTVIYQTVQVLEKKDEEAGYEKYVALSISDPDDDDDDDDDADSVAEIRGSLSVSLSEPRQSQRQPR